MAMEMLDEIQKLKEEATASLAGLKTPEDAENFRLQFLSRKGSLAQLFERLKDVPKEDKPAIGKSLNELRNLIESEFESAKKNVAGPKKENVSGIDLSIPGRKRYVGRKHPLTQTAEEIKRIFKSIGFGIADGPEIILDEMVPGKIWGVDYPEEATPGVPRMKEMVQKYFLTFKEHLLSHRDRLRYIVGEVHRGQDRALAELSRRVYRYAQGVGERVRQDHATRH